MTTTRVIEYMIAYGRAVKYWKCDNWQNKETDTQHTTQIIIIIIFFINEVKYIKR